MCYWWSGLWERLFVRRWDRGKRRVGVNLVGLVRIWGWGVFGCWGWLIWPGVIWRGWLVGMVLAGVRENQLLVLLWIVSRSKLTIPLRPWSDNYTISLNLSKQVVLTTHSRYWTITIDQKFMNLPPTNTLTFIKNRQLLKRKRKMFK